MNDSRPISEKVLTVTNNSISTKEIESFVSLYGNSENLSTSNLRYAKKLAALNLLNYKRLKLKITPKEGFVYVITNPSWPNYAKVGCSINPLDRLKTFNTSDPHRGFKLETWAFFEDYKKKEAEFHKLLNDKISYEWVDLNKISLGVLIKIVKSGSTLY